MWKQWGWSVFLQRSVLFCNHFILWPGASGEKLQVSSFEKSYPLSGYCLADALVAKPAIVSCLSINPLSPHCPNNPLCMLDESNPFSFLEFCSQSTRWLQSRKGATRCSLARSTEQSLQYRLPRINSCATLILSHGNRQGEFFKDVKMKLWTLAVYHQVLGTG